MTTLSSLHWRCVGRGMHAWVLLGCCRHCSSDSFVCLIDKLIINTSSHKISWNIASRWVVLWQWNVLLLLGTWRVFNKLRNTVRAKSNLLLAGRDSLAVIALRGTQHSVTCSSLICLYLFIPCYWTKLVSWNGFLSIKDCCWKAPEMNGQVLMRIFSPLMKHRPC